MSTRAGEAQADAPMADDSTGDSGTGDNRVRRNAPGYLRTPGAGPASPQAPPVAAGATGTGWPDPDGPAHAASVVRAEARRLQDIADVLAATGDDAAKRLAGLAGRLGCKDAELAEPRALVAFLTGRAATACEDIARPLANWAGGTGNG